MKIRNGFVSNSSSSCFICNYDGKGKDYTVEEAITILEVMLDFHNKMLNENAYDDHFDDMFGEIYVGEEGDSGVLRGWEEYHDVKQTHGRLIISSSSDNSIPWYMQDIIAEKFNATRLHLG